MNFLKNDYKDNVECTERCRSIDLIERHNWELMMLMISGK